MLVLIISPNAHSKEVVKNSFEECLSSLSSDIINQIAEKYFDIRKKPIIKVAVLDFTDREGNVMVGSRYCSDIIRVAFAQKLQFSVVSPKALQKYGSISPELFATDPHLRSYVQTKLSADAYVLGTVRISRDQIYCEAKIFGKEGEPLLTKTDSQSLCKIPLSSSGYELLRTVIAQRLSGMSHKRLQKSRQGYVVFLTQKICDDLAPYYYEKDGFLFQKQISVQLPTRYDYGRNTERHLTLSNSMNYVIKNFALRLWMNDQEKPVRLESYILPSKSKYYLIQDDLKGYKYRFEFLWYYPGASDIFAPLSSGGKIAFHLANKDWAIEMTPGTHSLIAEFNMVNQTSQTTMELPNYVNKFRFTVNPGLNVFVINYSFRRAVPKIFLNKIRIVTSKDIPGENAIRTVVERLKVVK